MRRHTCIYPSVVGKTLIMDFAVDDLGRVEIRKRAGKHMSIENIVEVMRAHDPKIPVFVDIAYPEVIDALKLHGKWVVR